MKAMRETAYRRWGKRAGDVTAAGVLAMVLLPVFAAVACAVLVAQGRPLLFRAERAGWRGAPFTLWKFRTMSDARDAAGRLLPDADRLTPVGRLLRQWSLDELPQLWNVLRGDMSLVGPRPLPLSYVGRYSREQARRLEARPGVTGVAQVRGRNALDWERRFALDVWYVDHQTGGLDVKVLLRTLLIVARRAGISHPTHATMYEFTGPGRR